MTAKERFAGNLRRIRLERGLSQRELAERIGRSTEAISHLERAISGPSLETIELLCRALKVQVGELVTLE